MVQSKGKARLIFVSLFVFALELFLVTFNLQTITLLELEYLQTWQIPFAYVDFLGKLVLIGVFLWLLLGKNHLTGYFHCVLEQFNQRRFIIAFSVQLISFAVLFKLSQILFGSLDHGAQVFRWLCVAWLVFAVIALASIPFCLAPLPVIWRWVLAERFRLLIAALLTLVVWKLAKWSQSAWGNLEGDGLAGATFRVVQSMLELVSEQLVVTNVSDRIIGIGTFSVYIAPECSGYEGVGLISAALALYLGLYRREFRFPQVLLLFPVGAAIVWVLNCVRIAALVLVGYYWSEDIAVGGFHSQAGWISFIVTALLLLWFAHNNRWLSVHQKVKAESTPLNVPVATLVPLVVLLASTLLTSALTAGFDYWYPLRVVVVLWAIIYVWPALNLSRYRPCWEAWAGGVAVMLFWVLLHGANPEANQRFTSGLESMPTVWAGLWLVFRIFGATVTVPIAEELAFRGYLLCKLARVDVVVIGRVAFVPLAVVVSSLAFGALHGAWIAGTAAGLVYAWVRTRSAHIGDAIFAHGLTNGLIAIYALWSGDWWLL